MFTRECLPRLDKIAPPTAIHTSVLRVTGISESQLDQTIAPIYIGRANLVTTILAHDGDLQGAVACTVRDCGGGSRVD